MSKNYSGRGKKHGFQKHTGGRHRIGYARPRIAEARAGSGRRAAVGKRKGFLEKGPIGDGTDVLDIPRSIDLPMAFSSKQEKQAQSCPDCVGPEDTEGRKDFRGLRIVTIDGPDAKDLDDAVSLVETEVGYELGVHIADVSHYVPEGSQLDREAYRRGTSVYIPGTVIPMLPEELSNGICSLNEGEDRLTLSVLIEMDRSGKPVGHRIVKGVIRSAARMSYPDVRAILEDHDAELCEKYAEFVPLFERMNHLAELLRKRREKRGAIDFDFPESCIVLGDDGMPEDVCAARPNCATRMIEEFMLAANEAVASEYRKRDIPFLYRVHEEPDADKVEEMMALIRRHKGKIEKRKQKITSREIQQTLLSVKGDPSEKLMSRAVLRTMQQACYEVSPRGHFGLAARDYCHFTSPIRRYPDLQIHRIISEDLAGGLSEERKKHYKRLLPEAAKQTSMTERRAAEIERECRKFEICHYVNDHVGEIADGIVSGVTAWGIYVELPNTVEGLVPVSGMCDDIYDFDELNGTLTGRYHHRVHMLGEQVSIRMVGADPKTRNIDFELL